MIELVGAITRHRGISKVLHFPCIGINPSSSEALYLVLLAFTELFVGDRS
jgi:hypothetical protein